MKRWLMGSVISAFLLVSVPAMADSYRGFGHPPGIQKQLDRGQALPPGQQKKFLQAHYRHGYDDHRRDHRRDGWKGRHHDRHDRDRHHDRRHWRDDHHHRHHDRDRHRHPDYRLRLGYDADLPPAYRVGRIIHDTQVLIESSHR